MPDDTKIKDLPSALQIADNAKFPYTQANGSSNTTYNAELSQIGAKIVEALTYVNLLTTAKTIEGAINELAQGGGGGGSWTDLTDTLTAGSTSLTFQDSSITTDSTIDVYTDVWGVNPSDVVVTTGQIVLTFPAQQADLGVKVRVL